MRPLLITLIAGTVTLIGCGDPSTLTREEAERVWANTGSSVVDMSDDSVPGQVGYALSFTGTADSMDFTVDCPHGGDISVSANASIGADWSLAFNMAATYKQCEGYGYTVDGNLDMTMSSSFSETASSSTVKMNGILYFTGEVEGTCAINLTVTKNMDMNADSPEEFFAYAYGGTICGFDAEEITSGSVNSARSGGIVINEID